MTSVADSLPASVLNRKAIVYVRQSTQTQVQTNLESKRRQYDLVGLARAKGFHDIELIVNNQGSHLAALRIASEHSVHLRMVDTILACRTLSLQDGQDRTLTSNELVARK